MPSIMVILMQPRIDLTTKTLHCRLLARIRRTIYPVCKIGYLEFLLVNRYKSFIVYAQLLSAVSSTAI